MKAYPSIQNSSSAPKQDCHVFVKYDGSNLRFEWSKKRGWWKFGTRNRLFDKSDAIFGPAIKLFFDKYADNLESLFKKEKLFRGVNNFIVFCEYFGSETFAGMHKQYDEKTLVLFDVNQLRMDILPPKVFLDIFGHLEVAELLGIRRLGNQLIKDVREGKLDCSSKFAVANQYPEGVVCKGVNNKKVWMAKIKTQAYYDRLKEVYQDNWAEFWE